jgi:hypothetical protein
MTIATHHVATVPMTPIAFGACGNIARIAKPGAKTVCGFTPKSNIAQIATTAPIGASTKTKMAR